MSERDGERSRRESLIWESATEGMLIISAECWKFEMNEGEMRLRKVEVGRQQV